MPRRYAFLLLAGIVVLFAATAYLLLERSRRQPATIDLSHETVSGPAVGPLLIAPGTRLRITTADFTAMLSESGEVALTIAPQPERRFRLSEPTFLRLREDLGRLRASWAARRAGEDAAGRAPDTAPEAAAQLRVEEIAADGAFRPIIMLTDSAPESADLKAALAPLLMQ